MADAVPGSSFAFSTKKTVLSYRSLSERGRRIETHWQFPLSVTGRGHEGIGRVSGSRAGAGEGSTNLHDSIKPFQSSVRNAESARFSAMSATQDFATMKSQLEERIASLAHEKDAIQKEVESLGQKVALKELEKQARTLEGELGGLKGKKTALEQKLASFAAPPAQNAPPQQKPLVRVVTQ